MRAAGLVDVDSLVGGRRPHRECGSKVSADLLRPTRHRAWERRPPPGIAVSDARARLPGLATRRRGRCCVCAW
ncbi:hypothetical protein X805_17010 [Sphaerotilus natans subsp. natans DSM 6575]|uniref:Uncharacterized protein n=1 Tax=Sphaerotilus natans subsp. natans DSM 6575 TaxID=1286631 RepID=A0A059KMX2_9BURK|nr:hypothetical protein X805_17010 [Sphaerotilus natans subsp. natans DSM 6575]